MLPGFWHLVDNFNFCFVMVTLANVWLTLDQRANAYHFYGDSCTVPRSSKSGICIKFLECDYAQKLIRKRINPGHCGFMGNIPLVCCPDQKTSGILSKEMCKKYYGIKNTKMSINVGKEILTKDFPHMVAVGYGASKTNTVWLCGGSLISHYFVLSAAHCVESLQYGLAQWIRLETFGMKNLVDDASPYDIRIKDHYVHPKYKRSSFYNDVALFKLAEKVIFDKYTHPACLHTTKDVPVSTLQATGWGKVRFSYHFGFSMYLMKVDLHIVDHATCARKYTDTSCTRKLRSGILDELQICAGDERGKDTEAGDSGGPLQYHVKGDKNMLPHFEIVGITSFGNRYGLTSTAGVYTRVSSYVDWIESVVWKEDESV